MDRPTRNIFFEFVPLPKCREKLLLHATFHWNWTIGCWFMHDNKTIFIVAAVRHLEFLKFSFLVPWLTPFSKSAVVCQISTKWRFSTWRPSAILDWLWRYNIAFMDSLCHMCSGNEHCSKDEKSNTKRRRLSTGEIIRDVCSKTIADTTVHPPPSVVISQ